jgi:methylaspartate mutase sigma subunit
MDRRPLILLSTVASDAHTWNLIYLQLLLEELDLEVVNLGPCVPHEQTAGAVRCLRPDVVIISSVNGHGLAQGKALIEIMLRDREDGPMPLMVIGGKLVTSDADPDLVRRELRAAGFDAVFQGADCVDEFRQWLQLAFGTRWQAEPKRLGSAYVHTTEAR